MFPSLRVYNPPFLNHSTCSSRYHTIQILTAPGRMIFRQTNQSSNFSGSSYKLSKPSAHNTYHVKRIQSLAKVSWIGRLIGKTSTDGQRRGKTDTQSRWIMSVAHPMLWRPLEISKSVLYLRQKSLQISSPQATPVVRDWDAMDIWVWPRIVLSIWTKLFRLQWLPIPFWAYLGAYFSEY